MFNPECSNYIHRCRTTKLKRFLFQILGSNLLCDYQLKGCHDLPCHYLLFLGLSCKIKCENILCPLQLILLSTPALIFRQGKTSIARAVLKFKFQHERVLLLQKKKTEEP